jgi:hypothetical protein
VILAVLLAAASCVPTTATHERWAMKTRPTPAVMPATVRTLTVADLVAWDVPALLAKRAEVPVDLRERQVYQLTGYVRLAKLSADDCDIHLQLSDDPDGDGDEAIVELPPNQPTARAALAQILGRPIHTTPLRLAGADAIRIQVTGFAFLDLAHATATPSKRGHAHGTAAVATLWELHPVFGVEPAP